MADHALATVTNPTSALTDFTLVVDLSTMPANWWTAVDTSDGTRGRVYKGDGSTELACDWIDFDDTAETGLLRVLWTGTLATTGTQELWIEPPVTGNAAVAAADTYGSDNAYDSSWLVYWPLEDAGESTILDRTSNDRDADSNGSGITNISGVVGQAAEMSYRSYESADGALGLSDEITISFWVQPKSDLYNEWLVDKHGSPYGFLVGRRSSDGAVEFKISTTGSDWNGAYTNGTISIDTWYHVAAVYDGSEMSVYLDAAEDTAGSFPVSLTGNINDPSGLSLDISDAPVNKYVDDVHVHSTSRSADWIDHEYDQTNDNATFWGTWSWESTSSTDALTGSDLTGGTPTLDTPTIGQTHSLTGSEVTSGTPTLDTPTIGQTHGLTGTEVTGGTPTLDTPTAGQAHDLTGTELTSGTPTLDTPTIGQTHSLAGTELTSSAPVLDSPTIGQTHDLTGTEVTSGTPTLGTPTFAEGTDNLTSADLTGSAPVLDTPTLGQTHALTGSELTSSAPALDAPTVGQVHGLTGSEITPGTPTLDSPTMTEVVGADVLTSADLLGGTPTLDTPTLGQVHALSGTDILGGVSIDSPALGQVHTLTATEITGAAPTLGTPTLSDFLYLFVENFTGTSVMTTTKTGASAMTTEEAGTSVMTTEYAETSAFN